ncbi:lactonase family protein [Fulvivirgaceae bacterium BMA10]|uniref:Lactonase family protein n=1 Tax=Splendidivirga corallicola TaxID=3051826 RepID=A0ABT8KKP1_9BACT|nr:lactonase family protein [Fulvivirgaceae bacterium BMA10]
MKTNIIMLKRSFINFFILLFIIAMISCENKSSSSETRGSSTAKVVEQKEPLLLFVGTYTGWETAKSHGIYLCEMNPANGALRIIDSTASSSPSYLAIHPNKKWLYAVNELNTGGHLAAFSIDREDRKLNLINSVSSQGAGPCHVSVDNSGKYAMVANYGGGTFSLFPIGESGELGEASSVVDHNEIAKAQNKKTHMHMIQQAPEGAFIYATDLGLDKVVAYKIDKDTHRFSTLENEVLTVEGAGPRHFTFHPNNKWMYVINELNGSINVFDKTDQHGALKNVQVISSLPEGVTGIASSADIHVTASGKYLYASNRGDFNNIAMFSIDEATGELTSIGHQKVGGEIPRNFVIDPSDKFLLVANQNTNNIVTFRIDQATGELIETGIETKIPVPVCLKFL